MGLPKTVVIEGKAHAWRDILRLRREQRRPQRSQLALFELKDDSRPASQTSAEGRYIEPPLFKID